MSSFYERLRRIGLGLIVLVMLLSNFLSSLAYVKTAAAAPVLGQRWVTPVGVQYGWDTTIGPLAVDLNGDGRISVEEVYFWIAAASAATPASARPSFVYMWDGIPEETFL